MLRIKKLLFTLAMSFGLAVPAAVPAIVAAEDQIRQGLTAGSCLQADPTADCDIGDATGTIDNIITTVINIFSLVVGVVSVIMIIIGGLKYITSGGDSGNVTGAKNTILYAVVGLVVVALAQIIVQFVLTQTAP